MAEEKPVEPGSLLRRSRDVFTELELPGDILLLIYFAVLARQYLWWLTNNNFAAWLVAVIVAAFAGWSYVSTREVAEEKRARLPFWLVAVLPIVLIYSLRFVFPDISFDVLNYRLLHGERALRGFMYLPTDFFPTPAPYNPAPDMVTGIFHHVLGYRLGTIANLLAMIWAARITDRLLRPFWRNAWVRSAGVLLALMAEHLLFEINNYMADLLAVPLLLEATYLALQYGEFKNKRRNLVAVALLLGMAVTFKVTNAAIALPIVLLCAYRAVPEGWGGDKRIARRLKELALTTLLCAVAFILPLVPFSAYIYRDTGSAVFPVWNGFFKSVYWPASSVWDPRWGGSGLWERLAWPILISFEPARLSELAVYSGRISLGFAAALLSFILFRRDTKLRELCCLALASSLLWSASTGYIRYALYIEVLATIVVLGLAAKLVQTTNSRTFVRPVGLVVACLLWAGLIFQSTLAGKYISKMEWSQRPTVIMDPGPYVREAHYLLRDRSLRDFLGPETREKFDLVEVWIVSSIKTASLEGMLQPDAPMIGINTGEYFQTEAGRARFDQTLERVSGKQMFTLASVESLDDAKSALRARGLVAKESVEVEVPYYSQRAPLRMFLIKVASPDDLTLNQVAPDNLDQNKNVPSVASDPYADYRAEISAAEQPNVMAPGETKVLKLTVKNAGQRVWHSPVTAGSINVVTAANRWLTADGTGVVNNIDGRSALSADLKRGDQAELRLNVTAPLTEGKYLLEIDMVHDGVSSFSRGGSTGLRWLVKVVRVGN